jgi:alpha-glucoside transport system permease protein
MSTETSAMPQVSYPARTTEEKKATTSRFDFRGFFGKFLVRATLIVLCVIWTVPTLALLITSFRTPAAIDRSGWWTALSSTVTTGLQANTAGPDAMQEVDGQYVIQGNLFEGRENPPVIQQFGTSRISGANTAPGETLEARQGYQLTVQENGDYQLTSAEPFEEPVGVYYNALTPPQFTLDNYRTVIENQGIGDAFITTATVTIPATIIPIAIAAFAAYAFAWMNFKFRNLLFIIVVALLVVPLQMSLIPILRIYSGLDIVGSYPGLWLAHTGFGLPLAIYLLRNYIGGLPRELIESAQIDGASHFQIFVRLILPLSIPALASFAIFQFLWVWNDLLVARVFLGQTGDQVLTLRIKSMTGTYGDSWEVMTSSAFISIVVPLIVFFSLQRYFVRGLLAGSIKGG